MPGRRVEISAACLGRKGAIRIAGRSGQQCFSTAATLVFGRGEGNDLDGGQHLAGGHFGEGRQVASVMASSAALASWMAVARRSGPARSQRIEIGAAGEGGAHADMVPAGRGPGDARCGFILGHIAGFQPGDGDFGDAGVLPVASISSADRTRPLRKKSAPWRTPWARIAPAAPATGKRPNCMR